MSETTYEDLENQAPEVPETPEPDVNDTASEPDTDTSTDEDTAAGTGRPRPAETIERDAKVLAFMEQADGRFTKAELVEAVGLPPNEVYLSLYRLGKGLEKRGETPKVERTGRLWGVVGKEYPEPVAVEAPAEEVPAE